jgi:hypothetical protein
VSINHFNDDVLFVDATSVLRTVIQEARKLYYKDLRETSENKVKTTWHMLYAFFWVIPQQVGIPTCL